MNIPVPDHVSESLETIFLLKNTQILWRNLFDPGSGMENSYRTESRSADMRRDMVNYSNPAWVQNYSGLNVLQ